MSDSLISLFNIRPAIEEEISKILSNVKSSAAGCDNISINMVHVTFVLTLPIITRIVNESIKIKIFPDARKLVRVRPIAKNTKCRRIQGLNT